MGKSVLLIFVLLTFVAINQAAFTSQISKMKLSEETNKERSLLLEQLTRVRRWDDYDWQRFLPKCTSCNILSIGNGYKNRNYVTFNGPPPKDWKISK